MFVYRNTSQITYLWILALMINFTAPFQSQTWNTFPPFHYYHCCGVAGSREKWAEYKSTCSCTVYQTTEVVLLDYFEFKVTSPVVVQGFAQATFLQPTMEPWIQTATFHSQAYIYHFSSYFLTKFSVLFKCNIYIKIYKKKILFSIYWHWTHNGNIRKIPVFVNLALPLLALFSCTSTMALGMPTSSVSPPLWSWRTKK